MSNEIATRDEQQGVAVPTPPATQGEQSALMKWAEEAKVISNLAVSISKTSFAGQLRGQPEEVTAVILAGHELGLKPMASLKAMDIIQGTPALRAHAMRGLVMSHGHKVRLVESTQEKCVYTGRRADEGEDAWQTVTWTLDRAGQLGLLEKKEWKKQPQTMLVARATGEICRLIASDVLHGVPYAAEELDGYVHGEAVQPKRAPLSVASLTAPAAAPEPQPAASDVVDVDTDDEHTAAVQALRDFAQRHGVDDIEALAHEELGAPVEHVGAQAIRELVARLNAATAA
ncbi:hypothetical protein [Streptomyces ortus]|uniref:Recombinase RecT n=1 Tax=Streptomyces ortus TaxID=2867268 RepID=A0ABT3UX13_9ACTN|nr:hypothetical protein [Streptomyces ortus]MCX4232100.1 hypothetical protein [Streptomyces ortus]